MSKLDFTIELKLDGKDIIKFDYDKGKELYEKLKLIYEPTIQYLPSTIPYIPPNPPYMVECKND